MSNMGRYIYLCGSKVVAMVYEMRLSGMIISVLVRV